jgi:phospholipase/carboxylesterase
VSALGSRLLAAALIAATGALLWLRTLTAPLDAIVRGAAGPPTVVMLHGYGSNAGDWLPFEEHWRFPDGTKRVYPQAPLRGPHPGRRGWWWLNVGGHVPPGSQFPDFSNARPGGIKLAAGLVRDLLGRQPQPIVLGGFSQGAMASGEIAFQTDQELAGLILLGGTTVDEENWARHFADRRQLPILIAHGRQDGVLAFEQMERFQTRLEAAGLNVTWLPFDGDHGIPSEVVHAVNEFVNRVVGLQSPAGRR